MSPLNERLALQQVKIHKCTSAQKFLTLEIQSLNNLTSFPQRNRHIWICAFWAPHYFSAHHSHVYLHISIYYFPLSWTPPSHHISRNVKPPALPLKPSLTMALCPLPHFRSYSKGFESMSSERKAYKLMWKASLTIIICITYSYKTSLYSLIIILNIPFMQVVRSYLAWKLGT